MLMTPVLDIFVLSCLFPSFLEDVISCCCCVVYKLMFLIIVHKPDNGKIINYFHSCVLQIKRLKESDVN